MDTNHIQEAGYEQGMRMACAVRGMDYRDTPALESYVDTLLKDASIQKMVCKAAALVLELGQQAGSVEHRLFTKMASCNAPFSDETVEALITPVLYTFAEHGQKLREESLEKAAGAAGATAGLLFGSLSSAQKMWLLLALGLGGAGGTLGWIANRDATQDAVDVEAREAQAEYYRDIAADLQKSVNLAETPSLRAAAESAGEANYVL